MAPIVAEGIQGLQLRKEEVEEEILQTKIVSPGEVKQKIEKWKKAIEAEIDSLFNLKGALRLVEKDEMRRLMKEQDVVPLPSKVIFTVKPDGANPQGKRKCRIVACGNYAAPEEEANYFAAGADAASLRLVLSLGARKKWGGYNMDVRTAFLNAPWKGERPMEDSEDEEPQKPVIIRPPGNPGDLRVLHVGPGMGSSSSTVWLSSISKTMVGLSRSTAGKDESRGLLSQTVGKRVLHLADSKTKGGRDLWSPGDVCR